MSMDGTQSLIDTYYPAGTHLRDIFLRHSTAVATVALQLNSRLEQPIDPADVETAAMLHDIGIFLTNAKGIYCEGTYPYIAHGYLGADLLRRNGFDEKFARVCERHTGVGLSHDEIEEQRLPLPVDREYMPQSRLERLICYADKFYSKSGQMTRKTFDEVEKSMSRFGEENTARLHSLRQEFGLPE